MNNTLISHLGLADAGSLLYVNFKTPLNKRKMKQEIMDLPMQALFCQQIMADDLDVWKGHVIATVQECTECYYGSMLLQDIIVHEFSFEEIQDWMANELGYSPQDFQAMLDFYSLKPMPDPIHDEVDFINEFCDDDYDYWLECSQDAMWITNNC